MGRPGQRRDSILVVRGADSCQDEHSELRSADMADLSDSLQFLREHLTKHPESTYAEAKAAAKNKGLQVWPIMYGRAKSLLGLVPTRKRGEAKKAREQAMRRGPGRPRRVDGVRRGPGRPPKTRNGEVRRGLIGTGMDGFLAAMRSQDQERIALRVALEKIRDVVSSVL